MAVTVSGTGITFNDATTQTTAFTGGGGVTSAVAGNGVAVSGATGAVTFSLGVPTNSSVGTYTAGIGFIAINTIGVDYTIGTNIAGSNIYIINTIYGGTRTVSTIYPTKTVNLLEVLTSAGLSGTWRSVARTKGFRDYCCDTHMPSGMWIRIA